jgi:hypothetical protein
MASKCECGAWNANIDKVNGPIQLQSARSGFRYQYDGAPFRFCPWCSSVLHCEHCGAEPPLHTGSCRYFAQQGKETTNDRP